MRLGRLKKDGKGEGGATTGWTTIDDGDDCVLGLGGGGGGGGDEGAAGRCKDGKMAVNKTTVTSMAASSTTAVNDMV